MNFYFKEKVACVLQQLSYKREIEIHGAFGVNMFLGFPSFFYCGQFHQHFTKAL